MRWNAGWMAIVLIGVSSLHLDGVHGEAKDVGRGKRWIRSHPFWISALTQNPDLYEVNQYRGAGLNTLLAWDPWDELFRKSVEAGLEYHYHLHQNHGKTPKDYVEHVRRIVEKYPGCTGLLFHDEPQLPDMEKVGKVCAALKEAFPELLVYSNALPQGCPRPGKYGLAEDAPDDFYAVYFDKFAGIIDGDTVMVDIYPLGKDGGYPLGPEGRLSTEYFENLQVVRRTGLKYGVPYWIFIQAYDHGGAKRRPSESDLRLQLFCPLTYGFTGISYFTYDPAIGAGLIDSRQKPTPLYYHARRANTEVANIGRVMRFLQSTGVGVVPGRHEVDGKSVENSLPSGTQRWSDIELRPGKLRDIALEFKGRGKDALIGFFEDDEGREYLMVTNISHGKGMSAAECMQSVTLRFSSKVKSVRRFSRETGACEELVVRDGVLRLKLPGGTGDLFRIGGGEFPHLPEPSGSAEQ